MSRLAVRPFGARDLEAAAALLAARHREDRARHAALPEQFESPEVCGGLLSRLLEAEGADGAVAERDGRLAGFLFGTRRLVAPSSMGAKFGPPRSIEMPVDGYGVAPAEDVGEVLGALYGALAGRWADEGYFRHRASAVAGDAAVEEAWADLGFGRALAYAVRDLAPLDVTPRAGLEVHAAGPEDIEVVSRLTHVNARHHRTSPILWPYLPEVARPLEEFERAVLEDAANGVFIAYLDGAPVAMHLYLARGFGPELLQPERGAYLFEAVVDEEARGGGIGAALLAHGLRWAAERGNHWCTLHYATPNQEGRGFWRKHGFRPLQHALERHIDERVVWARAYED